MRTAPPTIRWSCECGTQVLKLGSATHWTSRGAICFKTVARLIRYDPAMAFADIGTRVCLNLGAECPYVWRGEWSKDELKAAGVGKLAYQHHARKFSTLLAYNPLWTFMDLMVASYEVEAALRGASMRALQEESTPNPKEPGTTLAWDRRLRRLNDGL